MEEGTKTKVLENAPIAIAVHDLEQNILWANMAYQKATGLHMEELAGKKCWEAWRLKTKCRNCPVSTAIESGIEASGEVIPETQPGWPQTQGSWLISAAPLKDEHGNVTGAIEVSLEITGRRAEEQKNVSREQRKLAAIAQNALDAIIMIDEEGRIIYWSPSAERMFEYPAEEVMGKEVHRILMPAGYRDKFESGFEHFKKTGTGAVVGSPLELEAITKSGRTVPIGIAVAPVRVGDEFQAVATIRDISERKAREQRIEHQACMFRNLYRMAGKLGKTLEVSTIARDVVRSCVEDFGVTLAWIGHVERNGSVRNLAHFPEEMSYPDEIAVRWDETDQGKGPTGRAIREGAPVVCQDLLSDPMFQPWKDTAMEFGLRSSASLPLTSRGHVFGSLNLYSDKPGYFTPGRLEYLLNLAPLAATSLENARLLEESNRRIERITALRNIDMAITGALDMRVVYRVALDEIVSQLKLDAASIVSVHPDSGRMEIVASRGLGKKLAGVRYLPIEETTARRVVSELKTIHIPDLTKVSSEAFLRRDLLLKEGFICYNGVPLVAKGTLVGVLEVFQKHVRQDEEEWDDFLETLAGQVAIAIENAGLVNKLRRERLDLLRAYDETIEGWGTVLSLKEEETAGHSRRVTELAVAVATQMGMAEEEVIHLRRGALLHDIGKIGIPDSILLKPGKLSKDEWDVMKRHPVYAFELLSPISYLSKAVEVPYCHHEKWDGTGYPRGLKGKQIPLSARIFAVVDVWDALTSDRPYRKAWSRQEAIEYVREQAGIHFDPDVVDAFFDVLDGGQIDR